MSKMQYVYPAHFINEDNGSISVLFPDLDGCQTYDDTIEGAMLMAKDALEGYIDTYFNLGKSIPKPSELSKLEIDSGILMLVVADVVNMTEENRPVKKTLTIPKWLDREAKKARLNFSGVLQEALKERLGML
jgi:predicted RNase H-like HicB family nuclease